MPQKKRPPRLWFRPDMQSWFIKDGSRRIGTGCSEGEVAEAERALGDYIASKYRANRNGRASEITIADVLLVYLDEGRADETSRPRETEARIARLNDFFGAMTLSDIRSKTCRDYVANRGTESGARRDLEDLRTAISYYRGEYGLDVTPKITLPEKSLPRERWLTRREVAALLRAARRMNRSKYRRGRFEHVIRLILVGTYTGSRLGVTLALQWGPNTQGGWIDLEREVIHRRAQGERVAHNKRKTPARIPRRLMTFLRYWNARDDARFVIHYQGERVTKPHKAFRAVRADAGFGDEVTPHVLRHTRATWLANAGIDSVQAAASLGLTVDEYERTYLHSHPDFQEDAANAY